MECLVRMLVAAVAHPSGGNNNALAQQIASKYNGRCAGVSEVYMDVHGL